jgi:protein arginine kinase
MSETAKNEAVTTGNDAWYAYDGPDNDVILSTRIRLARNLANFPFPRNFKNDDGVRIRTLIFDSFAQGQNPDSYQALAASELDDLGGRILSERGIISRIQPDAASSSVGIVMRTDGRVACTINDTDHVRIASFVPGLNGDQAYALCRDVDDALQKAVQFAASYDFGFLTTSLSDTGSGMKASVFAHLPSVTFSGKIIDVFTGLQNKGIAVGACFGSGSEPGSALGSYYQISTTGAENGSEFDQLAVLVSSARYLAELERRTRTDCLERNHTSMVDRVYRAYAKVKFASLVPLRESVETISVIKWGYDAGILSGIDDATLCALLYRVQDGHLQFILKNGSFSFEKDIQANSGLQIERLRAVILQEAFEKLEVAARQLP